MKSQETCCIINLLMTNFFFVLSILEVEETSDSAINCCKAINNDHLKVKSKK